MNRDTGQLPDEPEQEGATPDAGPEAEPRSAARPSRRGLFGAIGAGVAGLAIGAGGAALAARRGTTADSERIPFTGEHQAGIVTPAQDRLHFAAFDMVQGASRAELISLLQDWSAAAAALTQGRAVGSGIRPGNPLLPPDDTGEAEGLRPGRLTLTFGLGRDLFVGGAGSGDGGDPGSSDPFGIRHRLPEAFEALPSFAFDLLEASQSGGQLCVQACADDPQVAVHAIRNLTRIAMGRAHLRWSQLGFGRTASTSREQETPRNLFGFKDGTANVMAEDAEAVSAHVWVGAEGPEWLRGGSYLVARKILMTIETWDRASLGEQERIIGRTKGAGGPLSGGGEFDRPDFTARSAVSTGGGPAIDVAAHVRLAHPEQNGGIRILRRGYNYVDGSNTLGQLGAGLFFISFQRDPAAFVRLQRSLRADLMNEYIRHIGSGLWAIPGGVRGGEFIAQRLFE